MSKQRRFILIAAALGVIGIFLPWQTVSAGLFGVSASQGVNGFHGLGILAFLCFLAAGLLTLPGDQAKPLEKNAWLAALATGAVAIICAVVNVFKTTNGGGGFGFVEVSIGFGCWIALAAGLGITVSAWLFRNPAQTLQEGLNELKKNITAPTAKPAATPPAAPHSPAHTDSIKELERLVKLKNDGHITEEEFQLMKSKVL